MPAPKKPEPKTQTKAPAPAAKPALGVLQQMTAVLKKAMPDMDCRVELDENSFRTPRPHLPSGSLIIDYLIGGRPNRFGVSPCPGLPKGKLVNLYGTESSGKSTLALTAASRTIAQGGSVVYIDWEHAVDTTYAKILGIPIEDDSRFHLYQPRTLEEGLSILFTAAKLGAALIVVDSIGSTVPAAVLEQSIAEQGQAGRVGAIAGAWSNFLPKLRGIIGESGSCVIGISQLRMAVNTGGQSHGGPKKIQQGGEAWKFQSDVRLNLRIIATEKSYAYDPLMHTKQDSASGSVVMAHIDKCRIAASQHQEAKLYLRYGEGIDDVRSIVEVASAHGVVKKSGSWYNWSRADGTEIKGQGMAAFKASILGSDGAWEEMYKAVLASCVSVNVVAAEDDGAEESDFSEELLAIMGGSMTKDKTTPNDD